MSSDGKEPGATWQNPQQQDSLVEHTHPSNAKGFAPEVQPVDDLPFSSQSGVMDNEYSDDYSFANSDAGLDSEQFDQADAASNPSELLHQLWHYVALIVIPLLFAGLTCLFVLPSIAGGHAPVPPTAFWPVAVVIGLIALAQGAAVYSSGTRNGLWILGTLGGFVLFLLVICFSLAGLVMGITLLIVLIAASVYLARNYMRPVPEGMVDIVYAFGKYTRTLYPGPNVVFPWEKVMYTLNTRETQWPGQTQRVQVSRNEDVVLRAEISYQLLPEDAALAVTQVQDWEESLHSLLDTALQTIATTFSPDDFLVWPSGAHSSRSTYRDQHGMPGSSARWEQVNAALLQYMRDKVALWGVQINWVKIRDVSLVPHDAAVLDTEPVLHVQSDEDSASKETSSSTTARSATANEVTRKLEVEPVSVHQEATLFPMRSTNGSNIPRHLLKEELLIRAYKEIHSGKIRDVETIRGLAEKFEAVAQDPELNEKVSFDAARAAQNLYEQAKRYEEQYDAGIYSDETKPDWLKARPPSDENLTGGG